MKKAISLIVIVALMAIFIFGVAFAVPDAAELNSQACDHASLVAQGAASLNSVVGNCDSTPGG